MSFDVVLKIFNMVASSCPTQLLSFRCLFRVKQWFHACKKELPGFRMVLPNTIMQQMMVKLQLSEWENNFM